MMAVQNPGADSDRRAHVRYSHDLPTTCRPLGRDSGASWLAQVRDVSRGGASLVLDREVRVGAVLVVAVEGLGGRFARPLLMRVMHVRPDVAGGWEAGCAFVSPLTETDVQALLLTGAALSE
ncbi:MAG TPA: PilZ domain-containing protein [Gemmataceae bacterium]|nr:PilZ domain-containing protein [Gemmataceae bacterium]